MSRSFIHTARLILVIMSWGCQSTFCNAQAGSPSGVFEFVENGDDSVLARLDINGLSTDMPIVNSLTFTAEGGSIFGFGVGLYQGEFEAFFRPLDEVLGVFDEELRSTAVDIDDRPFLSDNASLPSNNIVSDLFSFELLFADIAGDSLSSISVIGGGGVVSRSGVWVLVPEPSALTLSLLAAIGCIRLTARSNHVE